MKINRRSYRTALSRDEKLLYNIGGTVSIFDISGDKAIELKRFNKLKNPSNVAISSDNKLIAYKNTSGHIAIHEIETEKLLLISKCLSKEGNDLFFIDNERIISSEWGGKIFILNVITGETTVIFNSPVSSPNIVPVPNKKFIVFGLDNDSNLDDRTLIFELSFREKITFIKLCSSLYSMDSVCSAFWGENIYFYGSDKNIDRINCAEDDMNNNIIDSYVSQEFLNDQDISRIKDFVTELSIDRKVDNAIFSFNLKTNKLCQYINISKLLNLSADSIYVYGYFTCMCISKDGRYLLIGLSNSIIAFDLCYKKHIGTVNMKYVSNLHFISSDTKVIIGTLTNIQIISFDTLISQMK